MKVKKKLSFASSFFVKKFASYSNSSVWWNIFHGVRKWNHIQIVEIEQIISNGTLVCLKHLKAHKIYRTYKYALKQNNKACKIWTNQRGSFSFNRSMISSLLSSARHISLDRPNPFFNDSSCTTVNIIMPFYISGMFKSLSETIMSAKCYCPFFVSKWMVSYDQCL